MPKPNRRPSDTKEARQQRVRVFRKANRDWLRRMGWTGDAETLITAARRGRVRLTFEVIKKDEE